MLKKLTRPKIREQAAQQLKAFIVERGLKPGDRLPTETELADRFGISRLSVREATKSLEFIGVLEAKTGVGLTVGRLDFSRITEHLGYHPALYRADSLQLVETRIIIETGALPFVAQRISQDSELRDRLLQITHQFSAARDFERLVALDIEFHHCLLTASGLEPLVAFGDLIRVFFQRFRESIRRAEWKSGAQSHDKIIAFLIAGKVDSAAAELRDHIGSHKSRLNEVAVP